MTDIEKSALIQQGICNYFNLSKEELYRKSQKRKYVEPRQYFFHFTKKMTNLSTFDIALRFRMDRGTIYQAQKVIEGSLLSKSGKLRAEEIRKEIDLCFYPNNKCPCCGQTVKLS